MFRKKRSFPALMLIGAFLFAAVALAADYKYVASRTPMRNKYHYPNCEYAQKIVFKQRVTFNSAKEAQAAGYVPCNLCNPPITD